MTLYVNNRSAMLFWCMRTPESLARVKPSTRRQVVGAACSVRDLENVDLAGASLDATFAKGPLHVLVGEGRSRTSSRKLVCHLRRDPFPAGAFCRIGPDVLVASPELCFFEMAHELPFPKLVEFGCLLCGTYSVNPALAEKNGFEPLTTKRRLGLFASRMGTARGCRIAKQAIERIVENSASPRETKVAMLLSLPTKWGGYGFALPEMNLRVDFTPDERILFGHDHVVLDLYWREHGVSIEYDGEAHHSEQGDVAYDRRKSSELAYRGITVLRVDKEQLASPLQVYTLAKKLARLMNRVLRKPTPQQWRNRQQLFRAIM